MHMKKRKLGKQASKLKQKVVALNIFQPYSKDKNLSDYILHSYYKNKNSKWLWPPYSSRDILKLGYYVDLQYCFPRVHVGFFFGFLSLYKHVLVGALAMVSYLLMGLSNDQLLGHLF